MEVDAAVGREKKRVDAACGTYQEELCRTTDLKCV